MKALRVFLFISLAAVTIAAAAASAGSDIDQVLSADRARLDAMLATDVSALEKALTKDCLYVHSYGVTQTKAEFIAAFREGSLAYKRLQYVGEPVVRMLDRNVAVVTGRMALVVVNAEGRTLTPELLLTAVYRREADAWKLASYQSTPAARP